MCTEKSLVLDFVDVFCCCCGSCFMIVFDALGNISFAAYAGGWMTWVLR